MSEEVITNSAEETIRWGREFAARLKAPVLVLLSGDLGSGKTTLTKGIVAGLGAANEDDVTSPTFTLVHLYGKASQAVNAMQTARGNSPGNGAVMRVHHADLYRIQSFQDFDTLGLEDVFEKPGVVILEWAERFPLNAPWPQIRILLEHLGGDRRRLTLRGEAEAPEGT